MAQAVLSSRPAGLRSLPVRAQPRRARATVHVRAEGRVVREYREDDDKIVSASSAAKEQQQQEDLYVQNVSPPKQSRLSKEYKDKLRQEYVGLGGAEGQAMSQNWFLVWITIISSLAVMCKLIGAI